MSSSGSIANNWREVVADKTAASDARIAGALDIMKLNKELVERTMLGMDKSVSGMEKSVSGIKVDVEKSVSGMKVDVEKSVSGIKVDVEKVLRQEIASLKSEMKSLENVVGEKVDSVKNALKLLERVVFASMAVFIFGKQIGSGIADVVEAGKVGARSVGSA